MENKKFTPEERLNAVMRLERADRIPCAPLIQNYAARYAGISNYEYYFDYTKAFNALEMLKNAYPVWDVRRSLYDSYYGPLQKKAGLLKNKIPGVDLPENYEYQFVESEVMKRRDYSLLIKKGFEAYGAEFFKRVHGATKKEIKQAKEERLQIRLIEIEDAKRCGQVALYGGGFTFATDRISLMRSYCEFIRDVRQIPDVLEEAVSIITDFNIREVKETIKQTGIPRVMVGIARMCGQYFSLAFFERFVWPFLKRYINAFLDEGITPFLHLDGDWSLNMPYFSELPKEKIVLELDGCTDIFMVKREFGDRFCLLGDVPATLFTVGTSEKVAQYCARLVEEVGREGGFILGSGCALPYQAEHSNVEAFFNSLSGRGCE
ncbi:MAG: uroporphyrinogen decarboxylase family protein [Clostridiales bacterium]|jgi:uroporphyrinogen-III decarboxylase|nr:hypothetical protein [Eubacteriales bacterium]MDH7566697.1 uroporphyrinogen decarboxylase family protein [Clostridiales bacterium]